MLKQLGFYSEEELHTIGFKSIGKHSKISRHAHFYSPGKISIGDNVRIDDFCILSGDITLGNNIHISAYSALYGANGIVLEDNTGISPRCTLFSATDDFSGEYLIGPQHESTLTNVTGGQVRLEPYVQIGAHCVVMPNITLAQGSIIGANSFVNQSTHAWSMYAGTPIKFIKQRSQHLLKLNQSSSLLES